MNLFLNISLLQIEIYIFSKFQKLNHHFFPPEQLISIIFNKFQITALPSKNDRLLPDN